MGSTNDFYEGRYVFDIRYGHGCIKEIKVDPIVELNILADFPTGIVRYTSDGKDSYGDKVGLLRTKEYTIKEL